MKLIDGEQVILQANEGILVLTTRRIRLEQRVWGRARLVSMSLGAVASCSLAMRSQPWLLVLALFAALSGLSQFGTNTSVGGWLFAAAAVLLLLFLLFRRTVLTIASAGESIPVGVRGMTPEALTGFIDALEAAKLAPHRPE